MKKKLAKAILNVSLVLGMAMAIGAIGLYENNDCSSKEYWIRSVIAVGIIVFGWIVAKLQHDLEIKRYKKSLDYRKAMEEIQKNKMSA